MSSKNNRLRLKTRRRDFLRAAVAGGAWPILAGAAQTPASAAERPNLLFLFSDDQRADAMGCSGNRAVRTPNLDELAAVGVRFPNAFVTTSICCVSRVSVLTGQYARRHGVHDFATPLSDEAMAGTYPALLRKAGYYTGFIGKWGIAANSQAQVDRAGHWFDYWAGASYQSNYWHEADCPYVTSDGIRDKLRNVCTCPPDARGRAGPAVRIGRANIKRPRHLTTQIIPEKVEQFLGSRDKAKPFCLSISFKSAHAPWRDWDPALKDLYVDAGLPLPETAAGQAVAAKPAFLRESLGSPGGKRLAENHEELRTHIGHYYRMVTSLDAAVGKIRKALASHNVADNTVIIFTSDNGHFLGEHGLMGKWLMYEESIRVPLIVHDPRLPASYRGRTCDEMALNIDMAPTMLDLAGERVPKRMQGRSLRSLLAGPAAPLREDWFYEHLYRTKVHSIERTEGVRGRRWKYIRYIDRQPAYEELYDLKADPRETTNLARRPAHKAVLADLRDKWQAYTRDLK